MIMENTKTKQKTLSVFLSFMKGLLIGFFDCMPFFQTKRLMNTLHREEENGFDSFFRHTFVEMISMAIAVSVFFFIPMDMMIERYHTGIYSGMAIMILVFLVAEIYEIIKDKKKIKILPFALTFALVFILSFCFSFIPFKQASEDSVIPFLIFISLCFSSFISSFSGISLLTPIFYTGLYTYFANYMNTLLYSGMKNYIFLFIILFLAIFTGRVFYLFFQDKLDSFAMEKKASNVALSLSGFLLICINKIKAPWYFDSTTITKMAQNITLATTIIAFFVMSLVLTLPVYLKKKESSEL